MSRAAFIRSLALIGSLAPTLAACSSGPLSPAGGTAPDLATQNACRKFASDVYDERNRGDIYAANSSMNSPYSANYQSGIPSRGLADQFAYRQIESNCERDSGPGAEPALTPAPAAAEAR
jgi:hypothetical protein